MKSEINRSVWQIETAGNTEMVFDTVFLEDGKALQAVNALDGWASMCRNDDVRRTIFEMYEKGLVSKDMVFRVFAISGASETILETEHV